MATVNAISVALFNAAAGGYAAQIARDPNSLANAVGAILQKSIANETQFAELLLANFGVATSSPVYTQAKRALEDLAITQGRGQAVVVAIDFLKAQEAAANDYAAVALNFAVKVNQATMYSSANPSELDITKLVSGVTGVDTDQVAISNALAAVNPAFAYNIDMAVKAAQAQAAIDKAGEIATLKMQSDALLRAATEKAAADLKAANDKAVTDAAAAKLANDKAMADAAAALRVANDAIAQAAIRALADKTAAVGGVDKTTDNAAAITAYLKSNAALLGLTGYEAMTDTQILNLIKFSDNQTTASSVDKTTDNPAAITAYLRSAASDLGITGTATMIDAQLLTAIRTVNDAAVAAAVDLTTDNAAAITAYLRTTASGLGVTGTTTMNNAQLVDAIKTVNDAQIAATQLGVDNAAAAALKVQTDLAASNAAAALATANNTITQLQNQAGKNVALSTENDTVMGVSSGNDAVTATDLTYGSDDIVVDTSLLDRDTLTLSIDNKDITATPVVVGIENVNVNVTSVFAGAELVNQLAFSANNIRNGALNFDVTNGLSVVAGLSVTNVGDAMVLTSSSKFTTVKVSGKDGASLTYTGLPTSADISSDAGSLKNLTANMNATAASTITTDATGILILNSAGDITATAATATTATVVSAAQATLTANNATTVSVTATEEAFVTANNAAQVTIVAGDGIDASSATAIDSRLTAVNANASTVVVNVSGRTSPVVLDLNGAPNVNRVNVSGAQNVTLKVGLDDVDGLGTSTASELDDNLLTVSNTSTGVVILKVTTTTGRADFSAANVSNIELAAALDTADDITVASGANIVSSFDQPNDLDVYAKNAATPGNTVNIFMKDNASAAVSGDLAGGVTFHYFATATITNSDTGSAAVLGPVSSVGGTVLSLTLASGPQGMSESGAINLGTGTLRATGVGPIDLGSAVTANDVAAPDALGAITLSLVGAGTVGTVVTGSGNDEITIATTKRTTGDYTITTNGGNDNLTLNIAEGFVWAAGLGYDTLKTEYSLDLNGETVTMTGVDAISLDNSTGVGADAVTLTINSLTFNSNPVFTLLGGGSVVDTLLVKGSATADTINAFGVAVELNEATLVIYGYAGNDIITGSEFADTIVGGVGADVLSGGSGSDTYIYDSNDVSSNEQIVEVSGAAGTDTVSILSNLDLTPMLASSFDEIEVMTLATNVSASFTGLQLTGEAIAVSGNAGGTETVIVTLGSGETFVSGLTGGTSLDRIYYTGVSGDEVITGGALDEIITGGAGNDSLTGNGGVDKYVFSTVATNGIDMITFGTGDVLDFSGAASFIGGSVVDKAVYSAASVTTTVAAAASGDNVLFLTGVYFPDALAIKNAATLFTGCDTGNVLIVYGATSTSNARIAYATLNDVGNVTAATDLAILVGMPIGTAATTLGAGNFIVGV